LIEYFGKIQLRSWPHLTEPRTSVGANASVGGRGSGYMSRSCARLVIPSRRSAADAKTCQCGVVSMHLSGQVCVRDHSSAPHGWRRVRLGPQRRCAREKIDSSFAALDARLGAVERTLSHQRSRRGLEITRVGATRTEGRFECAVFQLRQQGGETMDRDVGLRERPRDGAACMSCLAVGSEGVTPGGGRVTSQHVVNRLDRQPECSARTTLLPLPGPQFD
jgi:hypothetical protein